MLFYRFYDMHSGGRRKTPHDVIVIEAENETVAVALFKVEFDRDPYNETCNCCGPDYSITDHKSLADATNEFGSVGTESLSSRIKRGHTHLIIDPEVSFT